MKKNILKVLTSKLRPESRQTLNGNYVSGCCQCIVLTRLGLPLHRSVYWQHCAQLESCLSFTLPRPDTGDQTEYQKCLMIFVIRFKCVCHPFINLSIHLRGKCGCQAEGILIYFFLIYLKSNNHEGLHLYKGQMQYKWYVIQHCHLVMGTGLRPTQTINLTPAP